MLEQKIALSVCDSMQERTYFDIYVRNEVSDGSPYPCMTCYYEQNLNKLSKKDMEGILKELDYIKSVLAERIEAMVECPNCHKDFVPNRPNQKFCKKNCRTSFARRKCERKNPEVPKLRHLRLLGKVN